MKSKLPRKRKKHLIKAMGRKNYISMKNANEHLFRVTNKKNHLRFPEFTNDGGTNRIKF